MVHILDENDIAKNYELFRGLINDTFDGERLEALNKMYDDLEDKILLTPASSIEHYHNAFAGGYIDHVLRVTDNAVKMFQLYKESGLEMDYDVNTVIFVGLHHDLGKVGNGEQSWYLPNESEWHRDNQGKIYTTNGKMHYMNLNDRTMWLLNQYGIKISEIEFLGIKLTDGMYDDANTEYLKTYRKENSLKTSLPYLMHSADILAARFENERWMKLHGEMPSKPKKVSKGGRPSNNKSIGTIASKSKLDFDKIFNEK